MFAQVFMLDILKKISYASHSLLFSVISALYLFDSNYYQLTFQNLYRILTVSFFCVLLIIIVFSFVKKNQFERFAVVFSVSILFFFNYGQLHGWLDSLIADEGYDYSLFIFEERNFLFSSILIIIFINLFIYFKIRYRFIKAINSFFTGFAILLFLFLSFNFIHKNIIVYKSSNKALESNHKKIELNDKKINYRPDIALIVLDAYANRKTLKKIYNFDNSKFINKLKNIGFTVIDDSASNYQSTYLSMQSLFKMDYLDLNKTEEFAAVNYLSKLKKSLLYNLLEIYGYQKITFSPYIMEGMELNFFDKLYNTAMKSKITDFERVFLKNTILKEFWRHDYKYHYSKVNYMLDTIENFKAIKEDEADTPIFLYAHIEAPHPPFIFDENNKFINNRDFINGDGDLIINKIMTADEYRQKYVAEIKYLNNRIFEILEKMIDNHSPPVIILMSDHGPRSIIDRNDEYFIEEKIDNLYAVYTPPAIFTNDEPVTKPIFTRTIVNTFRILFNYYFKENFEILPDKSVFFFSDFSQNDLSDYKILNH